MYRKVGASSMTVKRRHDSNVLVQLRRFSYLNFSTSFSREETSLGTRLAIFLFAYVLLYASRQTKLRTNINKGKERETRFRKHDDVTHVGYRVAYLQNQRFTGQLTCKIRDEQENIPPDPENRNKTTDNPRYVIFFFYSFVQTITTRSKHGLANV